NLISLSWGLPNGNDTWATDSLRPLTPLAVSYHQFAEGWNSGWFYFKYPPGHSFLLTAVYLPYLLWLWMTGGLRVPTEQYPHGFSDPESALFVLALLGRGMSALMMTGAAFFWFLTCRELFGFRVGWLAGWFFATLFPVVFYAHTTNVEAPVLFWTMLAFYGAARVYARHKDRGGILLIGGASAMALSTKEQALGVLVWLPVILLITHVRRRRVKGMPFRLPEGAWRGLLVAAGVFVLMNGIFYNPAGFWHRVQFLTHSLPEELRRQYVSYYFPIVFELPRDIAIEIAQLGRTIEIIVESMGWPLFLAAALGFVIRGWHWSSSLIVLPALGYYFISARSFLMLTPRYVLPITVVATGLSAIGIETLLKGIPAGTLNGRLVRVGIVALIIFCGMRGAEAARLLLQDPRYAAERWLEENAAPGGSIEIYQPRTYLPRFHSGLRIIEVPYEERSVERFLSRSPDWVVLSSAGLANITTRYPKDWREDHRDSEEGLSAVRGASPKARIFEHTSNRYFLDSLRSGGLGYALVQSFEQNPWLAGRIIPGVAPTIEIYRRPPGDGPREPAANCRTS
ncbi:MAG TPA: glycosyltransferase family 39 protein, partial [Candidatus Eisenbacteria bacterium]|nr:glycosyltransferase family 39 protein [Candidatus Eisenbacteria bacterium]